MDFRSMSSATLALIRQAVRTQNMSFSIREENGKRYHLEPPEEDHLMNAAESVNVISDSPTALIRKRIGLLQREATVQDGDGRARSS